MSRPVTLIALSLAALLIQTTLVPQLAINTIAPDIVLIWIVYVAITRGQIAAMTTGFLLGIALDVVSGGDRMLGLSALTKSLSGFLAGYPFNENKIGQNLSGPQFPILLIIISLVHNLLYFLVFLQGSDIYWNAAVLQFGLPTTLYTVAIALIPMFAFARHYRV
jgi:rod shape-determining protein MreD